MFPSACPYDVCHQLTIQKALEMLRNVFRPPPCHFLVLGRSPWISSQWTYFCFLPMWPLTMAVSYGWTVLLFLEWIMVPKTTFSFYDSLGELTELRKAIILMVIVLLQWKQFETVLKSITEEICFNHLWRGTGNLVSYASFTFQSFYTKKKKSKLFTLVR